MTLSDGIVQLKVAAKLKRSRLQHLQRFVEPVTDLHRGSLCRPGENVLQPARIMHHAYRHVQDPTEFLQIPTGFTELEVFTAASTVRP